MVGCSLGVLGDGSFTGAETAACAGCSGESFSEADAFGIN